MSARRAAVLVALLTFLVPARAQDPGDARELLGEIEAYDTQIAQLDGQIAALEATLAAAQAEAAQRAAEAKAAEARVAAQAESARSLLGHLYRIRRFGMLRLLFGADDPVELRRRTSYLRAVLAADQARTSEFASLAAEKAKAAAAAGTGDEGTRQLRDQLAAQREGLTTERKKRAALLRDIRGRTALAGQFETETARARDDFEESVRTREATMPETAAAATNVDFRSLRGKLPRPVAGRLLHAYGAPLEGVGGARTNNAGIDWAAEAGAAFHAVADGTVTRAGYVRGYGQMVMIQHGSFSTLYAHASALQVTVDQAVHAGQALGTVGTTGLADDSTPQLHFELRYNGTPQDPTEWLAR